jgi:hypothetical protein
MPSPRALVDYLRSKNFDRWITGYLRATAQNALAARVPGPRHLLFGICDHYEPLWGDPPATDEVGDRRVQAWEEGYPALTRNYRDADGRPPRHSFFFPGEEYRPVFLERLARLARAGLGEVELHLHHDNDTADNLRADIGTYLERFAEHGHIARDDRGRHRFAFIHGNWALANARDDGRWCGVDEEIPLLFELGCYADLTFPSAPDECQPNIVNQIYWPTGDLSRKRAYEQGRRARVGEVMHDRLLMIQGPLPLARRPERLAVRIETSHLNETDPPSPARIRTWVDQRVHVKGRPEWIFVKLHTHGAPEPAAASLLGDGGHALHQELTTRYNDGERWLLHYVTAREMYNIAIAAMEGRSGNPDDYRNYVIPPPPVADGLSA